VCARVTLAFTRLSGPNRKREAEPILLTHLTLPPYHPPMSAYLTKALSVWFIGFFPFLEIYVAVPASMAMGLGVISTIVWSVTGNCAPIILVNFGYDRLNRIERIRRWFDWLVSERTERWVNRYGNWFVLIITPWVGVWAMAVTMRALRMCSRSFLIYASLSILIYAIILAVLIQMGVDFLAADDSPTG
jgi:uncharacterized membrane protein